MSGHSKWATIHRKKGELDAARGKVFQKIAKEIYVAAKGTNGNPDDNPGLRAVLEKARSNNMPKDNIQKAIEKAAGTADSANLKQIILSSDSADPYNPKVVRSTMGAIFRMNIITTDNLAKTLQMIKKHKFEVVATSLDTDKSVYDIKYNKKVIIIGNETKGVSKEIQDLADQRVKIPMLGKTESLNASVAASIMIYEYVREKLST